MVPASLRAMAGHRTGHGYRLGRVCWGCRWIGMCGGTGFWSLGYAGYDGYKGYEGYEGHEEHLGPKWAQVYL